MPVEPNAVPPSGSRPIKVLLANDSELVIEGLRALLARFPERVEVIGSATGDPDIIWMADAEPGADVMLIDAYSRSGAGIDAATKVLMGDPPFGVAVFTETDDLSHLFAALRLGVRGYLLKSIGPDDLVDALTRIAAGETVIDPGLATEAAVLAARSTIRSTWPGAHLGLTRRESEVLQLLAGGQNVSALASELGIGRETIRTHLRQIYRKLGVGSRSAAVATARHEGVVN